MSTCVLAVMSVVCVNLAAGLDFPVIYNFSGALPHTALDFFELPFAVVPGTVEMEIAHSLGVEDINTTNIIDWGLQDANGEWRGWGGGNLEPVVVGAHATSRSYTLGPIPSGNWSVIVGKPRIAVPPGYLSVNVTLRNVETLPPQTMRSPYVQSPPLHVPGDLTWYAGDFHVHSRESGDAFSTATIDEIAEYARSMALLDFVHLSDHNTVSAASFLVDAQARHPDVLLLPGVEYTTYFGHAGALFTTSYVDHRLGLPGVTARAAAAAVHAQGGLLSINHMDNYEADGGGEFVNACVGCSWDLGLSLGGAEVDAVEVAVQAWDGTGWLFSPRALEFWDKLQAAGFTHIAPIGGSDDHHGGANETTIGPWREGSPIGSPTTMVLAANLSHRALLEGVRAGRTVLKMNNASDPDLDLVASDGAGSIVRVGGTVQPGIQSVELVATVRTSFAATKLAELHTHSLMAPISANPSGNAKSSKQRLRGRLQDTSTAPVSANLPPVTLVLLRNGARVFEARVPSTSPFTFNVTVAAPVAGTDRWRAELHEVTPSGSNVPGRIVVMTNHVFIPA